MSPIPHPSIVNLCFAFIFRNKYAFNITSHIRSNALNIPSFSQKNNSNADVIILLFSKLLMENSNQT